MAPPHSGWSVLATRSPPCCRIYAAPQCGPISVVAASSEISVVLEESHPRGPGRIGAKKHSGPPGGLLGEAGSRLAHRSWAAASPRPAPTPTKASKISMSHVHCTSLRHHRLPERAYSGQSSHPLRSGTSLRCEWMVLCLHARIFFETLAYQTYCSMES